MRKILAIFTVICIVANVMALGCVFASAETDTLQTTVLLDAESEVNIYGAARQSEKYVRSGSYSFYSSCEAGGGDYNQWSPRANASMFNIDLTDYMENGALVFWMYVDGDLSGVSNVVNVYLQSGGGFSWKGWYGYNVRSQITNANAWNMIVVPFSSFGSVGTGADLTAVTSLSIHTYNAAMAVDVYLDDFIAVSNYNIWQAENNQIKTLSLLDAESDVNIYGASRKATKAKQGSYSFYSSCDKGTYGDYNAWGFRANAAMFNADLTDYTEKGGLVFWAYVDGSVAGVSANVAVKLTSTGGHNWDNGHIFNARSQITESNAWNRIVIPFSSFSQYGSGADFSALTSISIQCYSPAMAVDVYYDDFIAVSDYQLYLDTHPECGYIMLDDCENTAQKNIFGPSISVKNTKNGKYSYYSSKTSGDNGHWIYRSGNQSFGANISAYTERGAFAFWMYVDGDPANIGGSINCWLTADTSYSNYFVNGKNNGYKWSITADSLKSGWNAVILPFSEATTSEDSSATDDYTNPTGINSFSLITVGSRTVDVWTDCYMVIDNYADGMPCLSEEQSLQYVADIPVSAEVSAVSGEQLYCEKSFDAVDLTAYNADNLQLVIEAVISGDASALNSSNGQFEFASSGKCDVNELSFSVGSIDWKQGNNIVRFDLKDGGYTGGRLDLSNINYFRMYTGALTLTDSLSFKIKDIRIEDVSYVTDRISATAKGYVTEDAPTISVSSTFGVEDISSNAAVMAEVYLTAETAPENIVANIALSSSGAADTDYISASVSDFDWKTGKNIITVPVSAFTATGTVDLTMVNYASVSLTASGITAETELYISNVQLVDTTKLAAASTNNSFANGSINAETAVLYLKADFADNASGKILLSGDNGEISHRFNTELINGNEIILPIGDFIASADFDYSSVNSIQVLDESGSAIDINEYYIINNYSGVTAKQAYMPTLFTDNMMFRQNEEMKLWGFTAPLAKASATLYKGEDAVETVDVMSDADGRFDIAFSALAGGYDTYSISVSDEKGNSYEINNILIGEIWLSGGQSNMEYTVGSDIDSATLLSDEYLSSDINSAIRVFLEPSKPLAADKNYQPLSGVNDIPNAYWELGSSTDLNGMSSLAYTFARQLRAELDVPVGIINTAVGGTCIETWISRNYIYDSVTDFSNLNYTSDEHVVSTSIYSSGALYHQKIEALEGFGISGAIWYQGESNSTNSYRYAELLGLLKSSWSNVFGFENNSMPFIFTQVAPDIYYSGTASNAAQHTAYLSEQMENAYRANKDNNMAMVAIYDLPLDHIKNGSSSGTIHPRVKTPVGERFALSAINLVYGGTGENSTPIYESKEIKDGAVYVKFSNVGEGLKAISGDTLHGFAICGEDNVYAGAYAEVVSKDTVKVWNPLISEPCEVTYAFETMNQSSNLANSNGIPASPFRTKIYNDRVNVADDTVTYYNTQEWMFADKDYWQNIKYASASVCELWSAENASGTLSYEYSADRLSYGEASLKVDVTAGDTVTLTPKTNVFGGKNIDLASYTAISVDTSGSADFDLKLIVTASDGSEYRAVPAAYDNFDLSVSGAAAFSAVTFDLTNLVAADGSVVSVASLTSAGLSFEISSENGASVYIDNIIMGTDSASETVMSGDVNGDGAVNVKDLVRAKKYFADTADRIIFNSFDIDLGGILDINDLASIKKILLG